MQATIKRKVESTNQKKMSLQSEALNFALRMMSRHKLFPKGEEEDWRDIEGFEGIYKISNYGRVLSFVYSKQGTLLVPDTFAGGYWRYTICKGGICTRLSAHRMVGVAFIPNPENKPFINHKIGVKWYNYHKVIEWATASENTRHALQTGLIKPVVGLTGKRNAKSKRVLQMDGAGHPIQEWDSANLASLALKINASRIGQVCRKPNGRRKMAGGYRWKFI